MYIPLKGLKESWGGERVLSIQAPAPGAQLEGVNDVEMHLQAGFELWEIEVFGDM